MRGRGLLRDSVALGLFTLALTVTLLILMRRESSPALMAAVAGYVGLAYLVELLLIGIAGYFARAAGRILVAVLAGLNAYALYIVHLNQSLGVEIGYAVGTALIFGPMLTATQDNRAARLGGTAVLAALPAMSLFEQPSDTPTEDNAAARLEAYRAVALREKPNLYLLSFDAMLSTGGAREILDIESLAYEDWLREQDAAIPRNSFVTFSPSIPSLDAVMKLDDNANFKNEGYFAGRLRSPLSEILRTNGYQFETGSSVPYYFGAAGDFVDRHHLVAKNFIRDNSLCKFAGERARKYGVFGFCLLEDYVETGEILDVRAIMVDPDAPYFDADWHQAVLDRITDRPSRPRALFFYYFYPIGHAPNDFITFDERMTASYRKRYRIQADKAREVIAELVETVRRTDPGAIVLVFGDHGPKTSRTADWKAHTRYFVLDNHAILFALMPSQSECGQPDLSVYNSSYHTAGRIVASVLRCLAEDPAAMDAAVNFYDKFPFNQYLYE